MDNDKTNINITSNLDQQTFDEFRKFSRHLYEEIDRKILRAVLKTNIPQGIKKIHGKVNDHSDID